jgi:hypothetical protein
VTASGAGCSAVGPTVLLLGGCCCDAVTRRKATSRKPENGVVPNVKWGNESASQGPQARDGCAVPTTAADCLSLELASSLWMGQRGRPAEERGSGLFIHD